MMSRDIELRSFGESSASWSAMSFMTGFAAAGRMLCSSDAIVLAVVMLGLALNACQDFGNEAEPTDTSCLVTDNGVVLDANFVRRGVVVVVLRLDLLLLPLVCFFMFPPSKSR
ncbi:hypothetical protein ACIBH1_33930 [Nonomuraea sp. NPDC050663]|uniref:hypothetical protein n=1 Tax=Nonomuraea sp. NPDC050663 TaxID=3364370 RepID=UPI0037B75786